MIDYQRVLDEVQRCLEPPLGARGMMIENEQAAGAVIIPLGAVDPIAFPSEDWEPGCTSLKGSEIRIVAIQARHPRSGAFRRLLASIAAAGLKPVIVTPVGDVMPKLVRRWKWRRTIAGTGFDSSEEWRPPNE